MTGPLPSAAEIRLGADADLHHRDRSGVEGAFGVVLALDADIEAFDVEEFRDAAEQAPRQQFERCVGGLIGVALRLARFHLFEDPIEPRIVGGNVERHALQLRH